MLAETPQTLEFLQHKITIDAPVAIVWDMLTTPAKYSIWGNAFGNGAYCLGSWSLGGELQFLEEDHSGLAAQVTEFRRHSWIMLRFKGLVRDSQLDLSTEDSLRMQKAWESYRFTPIDNSTVLEVEDYTLPFIANDFSESWVLALQRLKLISEQYAFSVAPKSAFRSPSPDQARRFA